MDNRDTSCELPSTDASYLGDPRSNWWPDHGWTGTHILWRGADSRIDGGDGGQQTVNEEQTFALTKFD